MTRTTYGFGLPDVGERNIREVPSKEGESKSLRVVGTSVLGPLKNPSKNNRASATSVLGPLKLLTNTKEFQRRGAWPHKYSCSAAK